MIEIFFDRCLNFPNISPHDKCVKNCHHLPNKLIFNKYVGKCLENLNIDQKKFQSFPLGVNSPVTAVYDAPPTSQYPSTSVRLQVQGVGGLCTIILQILSNH